MEPSKWRSNSSTQGNILVKVNNYNDFLGYWDFLLEGLGKLTDPQGANVRDLQPEELFKTFLELSVYPEKGFLGLLKSKSGANLGYIAAHDTTIAFRPPEISIFAVYTNGKCPSTTKELMYELRVWARSQGYAKLRARMYKRSGTAMRFFTHILGLRHTGMIFEADL